jgi:hypothetical protein
MRSDWRLRPWLRALHRDAGYLGVGLTVVYAVSGIAVNHIKDWDPSFQAYERTHHVSGVLEGDDAAIARRVLAELKIDEKPREIYRESEEQLDITFDQRSLHVTLASGEVLEQGQEARFFLRAANYLHLNRGKPAWSYIADGYAVLLLFLAFSGMCMLPGRKGFWGRGVVLVLLGAAVPVAYVTLSGS